MLANSINLDAVLNSAGSGLDLANVVIARINSDGSATLDFSSVRRMTPSFANAFVMTMLERFSLADLRARLHMENRNPFVVQAISESVIRYNQGIRLTTQQATAYGSISEA